MIKLLTGFKVFCLLLLYLNSSSQVSSDFVNLSNGDLIKVNYNTCTNTLVGNSGVQFFDIAFVPNGNMYGFSGGSLYQIDTNTAGITALGSGFPSINALVGHRSGVMYGVAGTNVYRVDPTLLSATLLGTVTSAAAGDLYIKNDSLYLTTFNDSLIYIDVNNFSNNFTVGRMFISGQSWGAINNVFDCNNQETILFSTSDDVYRINSNTASTTLICNMGLPGGVGMNGATSLREFTQVKFYDTVSLQACDSLISPFSSKVFYGTGTYNDTVSITSICDSIYTINLIIDSSTYDTINLIACDSLVSPSGLYTWYSSGTYNDTIPNSAGCDSVITINLTINNSSNSSISITACDSLVSPSGLYTWYSSGVYRDTLLNMVGCDSVIIITLTINNSSSSNISLSACDSLVSPSGLYTWYSSGVYQDTITNAVGCDSVIVITLTINNSSISNISLSACDSLVSPSGSYTWYSSGIYRDTLLSSNGCDSILVINLTVNYASSSSINVTACDSLVSPSGLYTWYSSGVFRDTVLNSSGCDSVITINLTINNSSYNTLNFSACDSLVSPSGLYSWYSSGIYQDTLTNAVGCDSILTLNVSILTEIQFVLTDSICDSLQSPSGIWWYNPGLYYDTLFSGAGCDTVFVITLVQHCPIQIKIPQFYSPNGDDQNDKWEIENIDLYPNKVKIFNRWGSLVFMMDNYDNSWNGKSNQGIVPSQGDNILPSGTYFYIIDIETSEPEQFTGYLYLRK